MESLENSNKISSEDVNPFLLGENFDDLGKARKKMLWLKFNFFYKFFNFLQKKGHQEEKIRDRNDDGNRRIEKRQGG